MPRSWDPGSLLTGHRLHMSYSSASCWDTSVVRDQGRGENGCSRAGAGGKPLCLSWLSKPSLRPASLAHPLLTASVPGWEMGTLGPEE